MQECQTQQQTVMCYTFMEYVTGAQYERNQRENRGGVKTEDDTRLIGLNAPVRLQGNHRYADRTGGASVKETFYRLFSDKDEILALFFEGLFQECFTQIKALRIRRYWDVVQLFFDFWEERKDLLALLRKNHLLPRVLEQSYQYSMQIFEFVRSKETADSLSLPLPYLLAYSVGGTHCMLLKWVEEDMSIPSSELISTLKSGFMSENI